ncbi:MAG TPA: hypothetical protein VK614_11800 [Allosphingosinicella sp.]|nr:hypothetical protein [Allosphingosinicella sp.]
MARKPAPSAPFADWASLGLPAFAAALAPWQDKLTSAELIPAYYQPRISILASVLGVLVCFCLWLVCKRLKRRRLIILCLSSLAVFIAAILGCLWLNAAVDVDWFPEGGALAALRLGWQLLYLAVFASFSSAVATALLLR